MFEVALGFVALYLLTWPALLGLLVCGILSEYFDSRGWTIFFTLVLGWASFNYFDISLKTALIGAGVYFVIGVIWSFWRYKRFVSEEVAKYKESISHLDIVPDYHKSTIKSRIDFREMVGTIVAWIIVWPFSFVESAVGDLITLLESLVKNVLNRVYQKIYDNALKEIGE